MGTGDKNRCAFLGRVRGQGGFRREREGGGMEARVAVAGVTALAARPHQRLWPGSVLSVSAPPHSSPVSQGKTGIAPVSCGKPKAHAFK